MRVDHPNAELPVMYVCQARNCRRTAKPSWWTFRWWLISTYLRDPDYVLIRCPHHISDWSLRNTGLGRSVVARRWAAEAKTLKLRKPSFIDPWPTQFLGALRYDSKDELPDIEAFKEELELRYGKKRFE